MHLFKFHFKNKFVNYLHVLWKEDSLHEIEIFRKSEKQIPIKTTV
jgi:hypothetical protein